MSRLTHLLTFPYLQRLGMLEADTEKLRLLLVEVYGRHCWFGFFRAEGNRAVDERKNWLISERLERLKIQVR